MRFIMKLKSLTLVLGLFCLFALTGSTLEARCRNFVSFNFSNIGGPVPVAQPAYIVQSPCYTAVPVPQYGAAPVVYGNPYYRPVYVAPAPVVMAPAPVYAAPVCAPAPSVGLSFGWSFR